MSNTFSPQLKLVQEWGEGFQKQDLDILAKSLHNDFHHTTYPRSVNQPTQNKDEWLKRVAEKVPNWTKTVPTTHSMIEAPGKVIIHFTNDTESTLGVGGPYESILIAHIVPDEDGALKIKQIDQFVDSKVHIEHEEAIAAAKTKLA